MPMVNRDRGTSGWGPGAPRPATRRRLPRSTACSSRCTSRAYKLRSSTARANRAGKTRPVAVSCFTRRVGAQKLAQVHRGHARQRCPHHLVGGVDLAADEIDQRPCQQDGVADGVRVQAGSRNTRKVPKKGGGHAHQRADGDDDQVHVVQKRGQHGLLLPFVQQPPGLGLAFGGQVPLGPLAVLGAAAGPGPPAPAAAGPGGRRPRTRRPACPARWQSPRRRGPGPARKRSTSTWPRAMAARVRRCCTRCQRRPRWGAASSETSTTPVAASTIRGPVARPGRSRLTRVPGCRSPMAPKTAASATMVSRRRAHWRAGPRG